MALKKTDIVTTVVENNVAKFKPIEVEAGLFEPVTTDVWYDKNIRSWVLQHLDKFGNQCGDAEFSAQKPVVAKKK